MRTFSVGSTNALSEDSSGGVHGACTLPLLIDPRCIPLLPNLINKSVQLGHHQQLLTIYMCIYKFETTWDILLFFLFPVWYVHSISPHSSRDVRNYTLELGFKYLGVEYVKMEEMKSEQAENLDAKIAQWIQFTELG